MSDDQRHGTDRSIADHVVDLVVFAPYGLALEARRLYPELVARGRRQVLFTRTVGKYAVKRGQAKLDDLVATGVGLVGLLLPGSGEPDEASEEATVETAADLAAHLAVAPPEPAPAADHLAIPDYDSLSAFQVMPRLEALDPSDLDAVRQYEESTRGRRTILNKIAQLS